MNPSTCILTVFSCFSNVERTSNFVSIPHSPSLCFKVDEHVLDLFIIILQSPFLFSPVNSRRNENIQGLITKEIWVASRNRHSSDWNLGARSYLGLSIFHRDEHCPPFSNCAA